MKDFLFRKDSRQLIVALVFAVAVVGFTTMVQTLSAQVSEERVATGLQAEKTVDKPQALAGETINYTVLITNTGGPNASTILTDDLPAELLLQTGTLTSSFSSGLVIQNNLDTDGQVITWTGTIAAGGNVQIQFAASITDTAQPGIMITNTAAVTGTGSLLTPAAVTTIVTQTAALTLTKTGDRSLLAPGAELGYLVVAENVAPVAATGLVLTDLLPVALDYVSGTLQVSGGSGSFTNDMLTWMGDVTSNGAVTISYQTTLAAGMSGSGVITNTAFLSGMGVDLTAAAATAYQTAFETNLPYVSKPVPVPMLLSVSTPTSADEYENFSMTVRWTDIGQAGAEYELQESQTADFSNPSSYSVGGNVQETVSHVAGLNSAYYYRVRAVVLGKASGWSNILMQNGAWADNFRDSNSGWSIRRQDTDDTNNSSYYQDGEYFVVKIGGRWDYAIASSMYANPWAAANQGYRIQTRVIFEGGVDNLHSYGLIFGGDWDGQEPCPNADFSSCFDHYYRLNILWYGPTDYMRIQLKRIDYHDSKTNVGRGVSLIPYKDIKVGDSQGWNTWMVEVTPYGEIKIFVNGKFVSHTFDQNYITNPYAGVFASANEYLGAEPWFDYYRVSPIP